MVSERTNYTYMETEEEVDHAVEDREPDLLDFIMDRINLENDTARDPRDVSWLKETPEKFDPRGGVEAQREMEKANDVIRRFGRSDRPLEQYTPGGEPTTTSGKIFAEFQLHYDAQEATEPGDQAEIRREKLLAANQVAYSMAYTLSTEIEAEFGLIPAHMTRTAHWGPIKPLGESLAHHAHDAKETLGEGMNAGHWYPCRSGLNHMADIASDLALLKDGTLSEKNDFAAILQDMDPALAERMTGPADENKREDWKQGFTKEERNTMFNALQEMPADWSESKKRELAEVLTDALLSQAEDRMGVIFKNVPEYDFPDDREGIAESIGKDARGIYSRATTNLQFGMRKGFESAFRRGTEMTDHLVESMEAATEGKTATYNGNITYIKMALERTEAKLQDRAERLVDDFRTEELGYSKEELSGDMAEILFDPTALKMAQDWFGQMNAGDQERVADIMGHIMADTRISRDSIEEGEKRRDDAADRLETGRGGWGTEANTDFLAKAEQDLQDEIDHRNNLMKARTGSNAAIIWATLGDQE